MIYPETYSCADIDLHLQLAGSVHVILNRRIHNPHIRVEFVSFLHSILPQKKVSQAREKENRLYKDVYFHNDILKRWLMHALIVVYIDSEKTGYYNKFTWRCSSANIMEYIFQDEQYR
jgi:hypothetical protein